MAAGKPLGSLEAWLVTGSQLLYGQAALQQVAAHGEAVAAALSNDPLMPLNVVAKPVVTGADEIEQLCRAANAAPECVGLVAWMHTFSPARMWVAGLRALDKPLAQLHTQFNRELPWADIDMDFMNLNQSAHGDREFGFLATRMRLRRAVIVGHWRDPAVSRRLATWARAAAALHEARRLSLIRFGDNMRHVADTEGDKLEAQLQLGLSVTSGALSELVEAVADVSDGELDQLLSTYGEQYTLMPELRPGGRRRSELREAGRIELGLRASLEQGGHRAFTDTFEDLGGLVQLPGIAVQRLMADGYGFGAEGDWKTAALVRLMKVMASGLTGGTSFMEDYTYHLAADESVVLGAHMLEVCPSLAEQTPSCEIHPLSIGRRADPVRLVFDAAAGAAIVVGLVDMGDRLRLVANAVELVPPPEPLPRLPVARAVWRPLPDLATAAEAWILAGGPHHTALSQSLRLEHLAEFAELAGLEFVAIDETTQIHQLRQQLQWNEAYRRLAR